MKREAISPTASLRSPAFLELPISTTALAASAVEVLLRLAVPTGFLVFPCGPG